MTPEGKVKRDVRRVLDRYKPRVWYFAPVQMGVGVLGIPDFVGVADGLFFAIETKAGNNQPTKRQRLVIRAMHRAGARVWVINETSLLKFKQEFLNFAGW